MLNLDDAGYDICMSVHDEVLVIADETNADEALQDVINIMITPPIWASDFPSAADGWVNNRYKK